MERVPGPVDPREDGAGRADAEGRVLAAEDEIWRRLPADRQLDVAALEFAFTSVAALSPGPGGAVRVLDLGCGDGRVAAELAVTGARVTGVDPSGIAIERARASHPELEFATLPADGGLPYCDASFDAVVCLNVLQHVSDTQRLLSEARRVLVPGGLLSVAVPWHGRLKNVVIALRSFERHHDPLEPVLRFYTSRSLAWLLRDFGFEKVELRAAGGLPLLHETLLARASRGSP